MSELSDIIDALKPVSTATITTVLLKHGLRRVWMRGTRPIRSGQPRIVGRAFTLRFIPAREDLATPASWSSPRSTRAAIEEAAPGCSHGRRRDGRHGRRHLRRHPLRTDEAARHGRPRHRRGRARHGGRSQDRPPGLVRRARPPLPRSPASPSSIGRSRSAAAASPSIPTILLSWTTTARFSSQPRWSRTWFALAPEQERMETWIMDEVSNGAKLPGLYPPNEDNLKRYKDWASGRS